MNDEKVSYDLKHMRLTSCSRLLPFAFLRSVNSILGDRKVNPDFLG